jgi:hypothetical protein
MNRVVGRLRSQGPHSLKPRVRHPAWVKARLNPAVSETAAKGLGDRSSWKDQLGAN